MRFFLAFMSGANAVNALWLASNGDVVMSIVNLAVASFVALSYACNYGSDRR
jgi:membrane protein implicated in regulation of membrane protease activity